ncbi:MAG: phosphate ABC transporter substrate-binding protein PstS [Candidatus Acidiferrales bacterium]
MRKKDLLCVAVMAAFALACCSRKPAAAAVKLEGAGGTLPAPLYAKWFAAYTGTHPGVETHYEALGSGTGVKKFIDHTVDFGASDAAMTEDEMDRVDPALGVQLLPVTASSIVLIYNLPGIPQLKLSRKAYTGIFLGKVVKWNDPLIAKDNQGIKLPAAAIRVVVRADSSGTTFAFTNHLSAISDAFARSMGPDKMPDWTIGVRAKGNDGVAATVKNTPGAIGYVAYGAAKSGHLSVASLENKAGAFVAPTTASGLAALDSAMVTDDFIVWVADPEPKSSYPIVTYTWMLCYKKYDQSKRDALIGLLNYSLTDGQKDAELLGYLPLPAKVADRVRAALQTITAT